MHYMYVLYLKGRISTLSIQVILYIVYIVLLCEDSFCLLSVVFTALARD